MPLATLLRNSTKCSQNTYLLRIMVQIAPGSPFPPPKPRKVSMSMVADAGFPGYREAKASPGSFLH